MANADGRELHVLVHNVSHTDIILLLAPTPTHSHTQSHPHIHTLAPAHSTSPTPLAGPNTPTASSAAEGIVDAPAADGSSAFALPSQSLSSCDACGCTHTHTHTHPHPHAHAHGHVHDFTAPSNGGDSALMNTFAKPLFASFAEVTRRVAERLVPDPSVDGPAVTPVSVHISETVALPVGLRFAKPIEIEADALSTRVPRSKHVKTVQVTGVLFPLVACLVPRWTAVLTSRATKARSKNATTPLAVLPARRIVYLVSGAAVPDDPDYASGTSTTDFVASIMSRFLRVCYPEVIVHPLSSGLDVFRFDDNANFFRQNVNPCINASIATLVAFYKEDWKKRFSVTISMAAGSPARLAALNAALRFYSPAYLHLPNVKAYWYTGNLSATLASVHYITFDEIEGTPAVPLENLDEECHALVVEMKKHIANFCRVVRGTPDYRLVHWPAEPTAAEPAAAANAVVRARPPVHSNAVVAAAAVPEYPPTSLASAVASANARSRSTSSSRQIAREHDAHRTTSRTPSPSPASTMPVGSRPSAVLPASAPPRAPSPPIPVRAPDHELAKFWLRKTRQPVLAVLLVRKGPREPRRFYYGMNLEVSMPTGSVCSERVAISMALADDPGLRRSDIKAVAVISMPKVEHPDPAVQAAYEAAGVGTAAAFYHPQHAQQAASAHRHNVPAVAASPKILPIVPTFVAPDGVHVSFPSSLSTEVPPHVSGMASDTARADTILMPPPPPMPLHTQMQGARGQPPAAPPARTGSRAAATASDAKTDKDDHNDAASGTTGAASKRPRPEWGGSEQPGNNTPARHVSYDDVDAESDRSDHGSRTHLVEAGWGGQAGPHAVLGKHPRSGAAATVSPVHHRNDMSVASATKVAGSGVSQDTHFVAGGAASAPARGRSASPAVTGMTLTQLRRRDSASSFDYSLGSPRERGFASVIHEVPEGGGLMYEVPVALNPIAPCGSCMEWLRKIAEVNPDFRILTFPDISCDRIFVKPVPPV